MHISSSIATNICCNLKQAKTRSRVHIQQPQSNFQIPLHFIVFSILLCIVNTSPVSYQYVRFVRNGRTKSDSPARRSRSFGFSSKEIVSETHVWDGNGFHSEPNSFAFEEHRGHITPDFSNGLGMLRFLVRTQFMHFVTDYPDPFLLTGPAAKRAASLLYRKPLFFGDIPHVQALIDNQEQRRRNGLAGNKLGSLRPHLPFYRFKKPEFRYFN